ASTTAANAATSRHATAASRPPSRRYAHSGGTSRSAATGPFVWTPSPHAAAATTHQPHRSRSPHSASNAASTASHTNSASSPGTPPRPAPARRPPQDRPPPADKTPPEEVSEQDAAVDCQGGNEPGRPVVDAERLVAGHHQPVKERRLVEVRLALQDGHDPLAA